jgi:hypothetical protein
MVVIYTIPSSSYNPGMEPEPTLDEVEILGPLPSIKKNTTATAKLKLNVNGSTLNNVVARITMTRNQSINNGTQAVSPATWSWSYSGLPTAPPVVEASWEIANGGVLHVGDKPVFAVDFNPAAIGDYAFTYTIEADELAEAVETTQLVSVTN